MKNSDILVHVLTVIDGETEELVDLLEIAGFVASDYHDQFDVDPVGDPNMLDRYSVGPDDAAFLMARLGRTIEFDFQRFAYFIEAAKKN
ncbi:MAG: hypothetical protein J0M12_11690 [Deltaproteobacteria bacterium]|nr:hypothetical protein [Deltaproteobacteria bacterium]